jgi:DNA modification methylase
VPCLVLNPFGGSGTTGAVAEQMGRDSIMIDLKPEYVAMAIQRLGEITHESIWLNIAPVLCNRQPADGAPS